MGQTSRADMIEQGVLPEQIIVTGNPGFDRLVLPEPDVCSRLRSTLGLLDGQKMILFASQPYYVSVFNTSHVRRKMINAIVQAACLLENVRLVIKPHPGDNIRELKRLIGKAPRVVIVDQAMDISPLIKTCDVLITFFSTVALQALYAGKPVINVDFPNSGGAGATIYAESGATWIARSTDEIATHIQNLTNETRNKEISSREAARQRFLYHMVYIPDGQATERVLKVVLNMLQL
jgi:CDP-glycerol glycerophosphotransferase (TagB/SpsB family)